MNTLMWMLLGLAVLSVVVVYLRDLVRAFDGRGVAHVDRGAAGPDPLIVYLGTIPFTNGDAWEVRSLSTLASLARR